MREIDELAERIWSWRAVSCPQARDDLPRLTRPAGWLPDVGTDRIEQRRRERDGFAAELAALHPVEPADRVDHRLLGSALARVRWELDMVRNWTQPRFYTDQALGPVFVTLLPPGVDAGRIDEVVRLLDNVPAVIAAARSVLPGRCAAEFTASAAAELDDVRERLDALHVALTDIDPTAGPRLGASIAAASQALEQYRRFLLELLPGLPSVTPIGPQAYAWFLREVACLPFSPDAVEAVGRREYDRAVVRELLERRPTTGSSSLPADVDAQVARERQDEARIRAFYVDRRLLSQSESLRHYLNLPMPPYLEPLRFLGVTDDLTGPDRLEDDAVSYVPPPHDGLPYFYAANARDPRAGIVHEGVHYQQLALSWVNERPVRRHYYDSGANEGIAFYNEELMLATGLFDDDPNTRITMWNFMRLRALRVQIDVGLALGTLTIREAAERLQRAVPMDAATAVQEAAFFAETPGQAITYQIGKTQILQLISDAILQQGEGFDLLAVHDYLWRNGNVPIALLRWELLGLDDEVEAVGL